MAGQINFFELDTYTQDEAKNPPLWAVENKALLPWLKSEKIRREKHFADDFSIMLKNLNAFKGAYYKNTDKRQSESLERGGISKRTTKYFVNHLYEMTENMVSRINRLKPAVEVIPANDEFEDKNSAKIVKLLIDHLWYINDVDTLLQKAHRQKIIFGNAYLFVDWDEELGDLSNKEDKVRTGDVCYSLKKPWEVLPEVCDEWDDLKNVILKEKFPVHEVNKKWNLNIKSEKQTEIEVCTLFHKSDDNFEMGRKIIWIDDQILSDEELGFSHGTFPFIRLTDIDVPGKLLGMSRYQQVMLLQNAHNNLSQTFMKSEFLMAAPKWVVPKGSINLQHLGNGHTVMQYQGPIPPQLVQHSPTSQASFNFRDRIEMEIGKIFGVHPVSRGEPPKGITAAVALQFLNEQENERSISDISKHNNFIKDIAKMSIAVAGDYYDPSDDRFIRVVGKENKFLTKFFDSANLHKPYDVRIQNSSALPQSKAARMERVLQTMQYAPQLFTPERWAELLEFGSVEKMHTLVTEAITSAESQVEDIIQGVEVSPPEVYEDLITHLRVYYKAVQKRSFKEEVPENIKEKMIAHIEAVEMLADEKAKKNPLFEAKLAELEQFPMFWEFATVPRSREQIQAEAEALAAQGQMPAGIPAQEPDALPGTTANKVRE